MNYIDTMKQALEALENIDRWLPTIGQRGLRDYEADAVRALRLAIEQAQKQEPVAWLYKGQPWFDGTKWHDQCSVSTDEKVARFKDRNCRPLYTAPPQRQPLTEEEIEKVFPAIATYHEANKTLYRSIARAIERAHGIGGEA